MLGQIITAGIVGITSFAGNVLLPSEHDAVNGWDQEPRDCVVTVTNQISVHEGTTVVVSSDHARWEIKDVESEKYKVSTLTIEDVNGHGLFWKVVPGPSGVTSLKATDVECVDPEPEFVQQPTMVETTPDTVTETTIAETLDTVTETTVEKVDVPKSGGNQKKAAEVKKPLKVEKVKVSSSAVNVDEAPAAVAVVGSPTYTG